MRPEMGLRLLRLLHRHRSLPQSSSASRFTAGPLYRLSWGLSWSAAGQRHVLAVDAIIGTVVVRLFRAYRMAHDGVAAHALVAPFKLPSDFLGRARQRLCGRWTHDGSEDRERAYKFQHWNDVRLLPDYHGASGTSRFTAGPNWRTWRSRPSLYYGGRGQSDFTIARNARRKASTGAAVSSREPSVIAMECKISVALGPRSDSGALCILSEARALFSSMDEQYAFGEMDEAGKRNLAEFAAESEHRCAFDIMPFERRVYFTRKAT
jgi:hypothetical protein